MTDSPARGAGRGGAPGYWAALAGIVAVGAGLRAFRLGPQIIIDDEWHALNVVHDTGYGFIFSHFGHADYSIPMALYFEWVANWIGLSEWSMRLPSLAAGVAAIWLLPQAMRPWLSRGETLLMAALIAISPFLINFSRTARPYALIALLLGIAIPSAWQWWRRHEPRKGLAWAGATATAAWLHPLTLVISTAPFIWFLLDALSPGRRERWRSLANLAGMGVLMLTPIGLLLAVPVYNDWTSLLVKAGSHWAEAATLVTAWSLFAGSGSSILVGGFSLAVAGGWLTLRGRDARFAEFVLLIFSVTLLTVLLSGAAWIDHALVLARYLVGLLPLLLALAAVGIVSAVTRISNALAAPRKLAWTLYGAVLAVLIGFGPVPRWHAFFNQFTGHLSYQYDYREGRNLIRRILERLPVDPFYAEIAAAHPDRDAVIVEAPWHLESFWNPLYRYQRVHGQRVLIGFVNGLCSEPFYGELAHGATGMRFRNFVDVAAVIDGTIAADYLILRHTGVPGSREIPADMDRCVEYARQRLGEPWRASSSAQVFKIPRPSAR